MATGSGECCGKQARFFHSGDQEDREAREKLSCLFLRGPLGTGLSGRCLLEHAVAVLLAPSSTVEPEARAALAGGALAELELSPAAVGDLGGPAAEAADQRVEVFSVGGDVPHGGEAVALGRAVLSGRSGGHGRENLAAVIYALPSHRGVGFVKGVVCFIFAYWSGSSLCLSPRGPGPTPFTSRDRTGCRRPPSPCSASKPPQPTFIPPRWALPCGVRRGCWPAVCS